MEPRQRRGQLASVHDRHPQIGQHQFHVVIGQLQNSQGAGAVTRLENARAFALQ